MAASASSAVWPGSTPNLPAGSATWSSSKRASAGGASAESPVYRRVPWPRSASCRIGATRKLSAVISRLVDPKRIRAVRGMERGDLQRYLPKIAQCVEKALALQDSELPRLERKSSRPQLNLLGQFLSTALGRICRSAQVAPSLAGTAQDVRDLIAYRLNLGGFEEGELPVLAQGWRAEVVGQVIDHLLAGDVAVRIADPLHDEPLVFERRNNVE
jgi:hypothetical protein